MKSCSRFLIEVAYSCAKIHLLDSEWVSVFSLPHHP